MEYGRPSRWPRTPRGPVAAREWDVAHAAALRALLTQPPAVLPTQVDDPPLPLQIGIWDALLACCGPGLSRKLWRNYTRSTGYLVTCVRKDAMRHDLDGRPPPATVPSSVNRAPACLGLAGRPGALAGKRTHCISSARADWPDLRAALDYARGVMCWSPGSSTGSAAPCRTGSRR
jgi:hypothetical protein